MSQKTNIEELAKVTDPNVADELGRTALHHYAAQGNVEATAALIDNGARLDQKDKEGKTPLDLASEAGAPEELLGDSRLSQITLWPCPFVSHGHAAMHLKYWLSL